MGSLTLRTTLQARGPAAAVVLDDDHVAELGEGAKRFPVVATINGYTWRGSVARMRGEFLLGLNREVRQAAGVAAGDEVEARIALDSAPRQIDVPADLAAALDADPAVRTRFDGLALTHRKEFVRWVEEAKRPETRERRIVKSVEMVQGGQTRS